MSDSYKGIIVANIVEVRFAFSGKTVAVRKKTGDNVNKWETIASLDRKVLQMELDRQLADYEKVRGEFEIYNIKAGQGGDDIAKFTRQQKQAELNIAVKDVELAKYKLDQADLISPVNGIILEIEGLVTGLHVSPASNPVTIIDRESLRFQLSISQKDLDIFTAPRKATIIFKEHDKTYTGMTISPLWDTKEAFTVYVDFDDASGLLPGMKGELTL